MKICIAGKNNIAVDVLLHVVKHVDRKDIIILPNKNDLGKNTWQKSLLFHANILGLRVVSLEEVYDVEDLLFLSLEYDRIIDPGKFLSQSLYNIHFSLLPAYKGMYTSLLPILYGEKESGITIHKIDKGIDTGDILFQYKFPLYDDTTCRELYYTYLQVGTTAIIQHFEELIRKNFTAVPQTSTGSTYYSKAAFDFKNTGIDLNQTAFQIKRNFNALIFREYQMPKLSGKPICRIEITNQRSKQKSGTLLKEDEEKFNYAAVDFDYIAYKDYFEELIHCALVNDISKLRSIIRYTPNLDETNAHGWTPLIVACYNGSKDVAELLLQHGAKPNQANLNGTTPLMYAKDYAIKSGETSIIDTLKNFGADWQLKDVHNKTVVDYISNSDLDWLVNKIIT